MLFGIVFACITCSIVVGGMMSGDVARNCKELNFREKIQK
jgi:hypothetical protein